MKRKCFLAMGFMVLVVFFVSVSAWSVPPLINYQGKLTDDLGNPLTGSYKMKFLLYDVPTGGTAPWEEEHLNVVVTDGIYNVQLGSKEDFPENLFNLFDYEYLYLEVKIWNSGTSSYETLTPRQRLVSTAYAMNAGTLDGLDSTDFLTSTQPGSMTAETSLPVFAVANTGSGNGLSGSASGNTGSGVYGYSSAESGVNYGVYGQTDSSGLVYQIPPFPPTYLPAYGVFGDTTATEGTTVGVFGRSSGTVLSAGVEGKATATGDVENVGGRFSAAGNSGFGVYGEAAATGDVKNYGGYFVANGDKGQGVHGYASGKYGRGVQAEATGSSGSGVFGWASNDGDVTNYGGYFWAEGKYGRGVQAEVTGSGGYGVYGKATGAGVGVMGVSGTGNGLYGENSETANHGAVGGNWYGVWGQNGGSGTVGVLAHNRAGVYGERGPGGDYAGEFKGNVIIRSESTGATVIELGEGLDYAEGFHVSERTKVVAGSVLIIDPDNPGKLTLSNKPYDSKVAGIVTGAKGMGSGVRLGSEQFDYDVALAGRVYCNVDASYGKVSPGDLLTTSPTPGYAMKVSDYTKAQGAILGKAMEKLPEGVKGQILVLVTLQ